MRSGPVSSEEPGVWFCDAEHASGSLSPYGTGAGTKSKMWYSKSRSGKTLVVILVVCSVLSIAVGGGVAMLLSKKASADGGKAEKKHPEPKTICSLDELVVNLADADTMRYVKVAVGVGFEEKTDDEHLKEVTPILKDAVITYFSGRTFKQLRGREGVEKAKKELLEQVKERVHHFHAIEVYLEGFAMQ
jgi:flagellar basal body-associated protein FliL